MKVLITGASGNIGSYLQLYFRQFDWDVVLADVKDGPTHALKEQEQYTQVDITNLDSLTALMEGVTTVVHLAGIPTEDTWDKILQVNINGTRQVFEAAKLAGVKQVIFASSNHAVGFYKSDEILDEKTPPKPDTYYGVSKATGEALASLYADKYGLSTVSIRIGSFEEKPTEKRHLSTWVSKQDLGQQIVSCINHPMPGRHIITYGVSNNTDKKWFDKSFTLFGNKPKDDANDHKDTITKMIPAEEYHGGKFCRV